MKRNSLDADFVEKRYDVILYLSFFPFHYPRVHTISQVLLCIRFPLQCHVQTVLRPEARMVILAVVRATAWSLVEFIRDARTLSLVLASSKVDMNRESKMLAQVICLMDVH